MFEPCRARQGSGRSCWGFGRVAASNPVLCSPDGGIDGGIPGDPTLLHDDPKRGLRAASAALGGAGGTSPDAKKFGGVKRPN